MDKYINVYSLIPITSENAAAQSVLRNLTKMYCCEWSQYTGMDVDDKGEYAFEKYLPSYWESNERKSFLLSCKTELSDSRWAGFALIDKDFCIHKDFDYSLAEFFILYKYRRHGAGRWMATALFDRFPGRWELGRNPKNLAAFNFWDNVINDYTHGQYELVCASPEHRYIDGTLGDVFSFDNSSAANENTKG